MKRISRDHTVPVERRYRVLEPVGEVELGESFVVETINFRTPVIRTPEDANPAVYREREETGLIYVKGIEARDILAIHIEDIRPVGHASGGWYDESKRNSFLKIEDGKVHFPGGLWVPLRMMIGDIYVTPAGPCTNPDRNGGNMDFKDVSVGNTLYLRAEREGGLLVLGDVHACQGDGEILGLGAECAANVQLRITRDERYLPVRPMIRKASSFVCISSREDDYASARDEAAENAARILSRIAGVTHEEAMLYCKTVGDLRNGAVWMLGNEEVPWRRMVTVGLQVPLFEWGEGHAPRTVPRTSPPNPSPRVERGSTLWRASTCGVPGVGHS